MIMNYNCRVEIERVNGKFVTQVEISNYGRAKRSRHSAETMDDALAIVAKAHNDGLAEIEAFLRPAPVAVEAAQPSSGPVIIDVVDVGEVVLRASEVAAPKIDGRSKEARAIKRRFAAA